MIGDRYPMADVEPVDASRRLVSLRNSCWPDRFRLGRCHSAHKPQLLQEAGTALTRSASYEDGFLSERRHVTLGLLLTHGPECTDLLGSEDAYRLCEVAQFMMADSGARGSGTHASPAAGMRA